MSDATTSYLQSELQKAQRTFRVAIIAMSIMFVVFVGYFQWLKSELADVLTPSSVAELVINQARGALPQITESLKYNVRDEAPNLVHFVLHTAVDQALPLVSQSFESNLEEYARDVEQVGAAHTDAALQKVLTAYKGNTKIAKKQDPAAFATLLGAQIEAQLGSQLDIAAKDAVKQRLDKSGETLKHINQELLALAHHDGSNRENQLGKHLITSWWSFLDRGRPAIAGEKGGTGGVPDGKDNTVSKKKSEAAKKNELASRH